MPSTTSAPSGTAALPAAASSAISPSITTTSWQAVDAGARVEDVGAADDERRRGGAGPDERAHAGAFSRGAGCGAPAGWAVMTS